VGEWEGEVCCYWTEGFGWYGGFEEDYGLMIIFGMIEGLGNRRSYDTILKVVDY